MRKIISYAEDPGAANFLLPLHKELCNAGFNSVSLVSQELNEYAKIKNFDFRIVSSENIFKFIESIKPEIILCGTSENNKNLGFKLIDYARKKSIATISVVDMCVNLSKRFSDNSSTPLKYAPNYIAACDSSVANYYKEIGFPKENIFVCCNPNIERLMKDKDKYLLDCSISKRRTIFNCSQNETIFLFLTEGIDKLSPNESYKDSDYSLMGRGDNDFRSVIILQELIDVIRKINSNIKLFIRLHPKDDIKNYKNVLDDVDGIDSNKDPIQSVLSADLIVGMSTMLLFEAYILDKQTLSILPKREQKQWLPNTANNYTPVAYSREDIKKYILEFLEHGNINTRMNHALEKMINNSSKNFINFIKTI